MCLNGQGKRILIIFITIIGAFSAAFIIYNVLEKSKCKVYFNELNHVSLKYPKHWVLNPIYYERYEGEDGFFSCDSAFAKSFSIDEAAEMIAYHKMMPFGLKPQIKAIEIQGQEGRLILPSADQPTRYKKLAEIVVKYPRPVEINGTVYYFFTLAADKEHIESIAESIEFVY